jgi:hypothetical protein
MEPHLSPGWYQGNLPSGVLHGLNDSVKVLRGPLSGARGAVISLIAVHPEPRYLIELDSGDDVELEQSVLGAA